jgi:hypothetical protein
MRPDSAGNKPDAETTEEAPTNDSEEPPSPARVGHRSGVDDALAEALRGATAAGRWDVVAQLCREIEARRLATMPNVIALHKKTST